MPNHSKENLLCQSDKLKATTLSNNYIGGC